MKGKLKQTINKAKCFTKKASEITSKATDIASRTAHKAASAVLDQDGDGNFDRKDMDILLQKGAKAAKEAGNKSLEAIEHASKSTLAKDAAAGAAIGAVVAIPVPIIGPVAGAVIGAGLGIYKNITGKGTPNYPTGQKEEIQKDIHGEILKLGDLKDKGLITVEEFEEQKRKLFAHK